jgi:hypothetical protein
MIRLRHSIKGNSATDEHAGKEPTMKIKTLATIAILGLGLIAQTVQAQQWGGQQQSNQSQAQRACGTPNGLDYACFQRFQAQQTQQAEMERLNRPNQNLDRVINVACAIQGQGGRIAQTTGRVLFGPQAGLIAGGVYRVSVNGTYTLIGQNPCR